ncbi:pesticin C-terminus-like muramidase [Elstera sp.]|jgi:hypothetical protein|uniref:pesticin C-terminus-like muramidase n=1 Tax=Elstera sp. TaxID=1916664 RepID=UPI0037BE6DE5
MTNILERVQALAPAALTEKARRLLSSTPEEAGAWLTQGQTAGLKSEAALVHHAHLQQRLTQMRVETLRELSEPQTARDPKLKQRLTQRLADIETAKTDVAQKMADPRLSEEQKLEDGYGRINAVAEDHQKAPIAQVDKTIRTLCSFRAVNGILRTCGKQPNCVGTFSRAPMSEKLSNDINAMLGTNIDHVKVSEWEGGQSLTGYVPWFKGVRHNNSGITIASGVDLGKNNENFMRSFNKIYPAPPGLIDRLVPYMEKVRQDACTYLSDHPLVVSQQEADWLDQWAAFGRFYPSEHSNDVRGNTEFARYNAGRNKLNIDRRSDFDSKFREYKQKLEKWEKDGKIGPKPIEPTQPVPYVDFRQLTRKDQTIFYSRQYQNGVRTILEDRLLSFIQQDWDRFWSTYPDDPRIRKEKSYHATSR